VSYEVQSGARMCKNELGGTKMSKGNRIHDNNWRASIQWCTAMLARDSLQLADVWGFVKTGTSKCLELFIPKQVCGTCTMAREGL
jgi:hypothetical protein